MLTIQLEIPDELAHQLAPHQDNLLEFIKMGLDAWQKSEQNKEKGSAARLQQLLAASGKLVVPTLPENGKTYQRKTPISISGKPVSQIVIEERGAL